MSHSNKISGPRPAEMTAPPPVDPKADKTTSNITAAATDDGGPALDEGEGTTNTTAAEKPSITTLNRVAAARLGMGIIDIVQWKGKVEIGEFNERELDGNAVKTLVAEFKQETKRWERPMVFMVDRDDIENIEDLTKENMFEDGTVVQFASSVNTIHCLAGQHRIAAIIDVVEQVESSLPLLKKWLQERKDKDRIVLDDEMSETELKEQIAIQTKQLSLGGKWMVEFFDKGVSVNMLDVRNASADCKPDFQKK
jgi:hypothetical protein